MQMSMLAMLIQMETEVIITHLESPVDPVMAPQARRCVVVRLCKQ